MIFQKYKLHVSKRIRQNQDNIVKRTRLGFIGDIAYFTSKTIVTEDGSLQRIKATFMTKIQFIWFWKYPGSVVQGFTIVPNSAYFDENRQFPRIIKHIIFPRTNKVLPTTWKYLIDAPKQNIPYQWSAVYLFRSCILLEQEAVKVIESFWYLTHSGLVTPYGDSELGQHIGSGNSLLPDGTKSLPEPMLTDRQWNHSYYGNFTRDAWTINR